MTNRGKAARAGSLPASGGAPGGPRRGARRAFAPVHPGAVIRHDYLEPLGMSQYALAKALGITQARLGEIVRGRRAITPDTALRLARYFRTSAEFWTGMQAQYDLERARDALAAAIAREVTPRAA